MFYELYVSGHSLQEVVATDRGCLLAKFDVEGAFRMVPVHPDDRWLLGMK